MNCYYHPEREAVGMCVACGKPICPECKVMLKDKFYCNPCADKMFSSKADSAASVIENTSGQGSSAVVPKEIRGWNWGGFFLSWIWGIGNKSWLAVLFGIIAWILSTVADQSSTTERVDWIWILTILTLGIIGIKGNQWAWQSKRWDDIAHFKKTQRIWTIWGLAIFIFFLIVGILVGIGEAFINVDNIAI